MLDSYLGSNMKHGHRPKPSTPKLPHFTESMGYSPCSILSLFFLICALPAQPPHPFTKRTVVLNDITTFVVHWYFLLSHNQRSIPGMEEYSTRGCALHQLVGGTCINYPLGMDYTSAFTKKLKSLFGIETITVYKCLAHCRIGQFSSACSPVQHCNITGGGLLLEGWRYAVQPDCTNPLKGNPQKVL